MSMERAGCQSARFSYSNFSANSFMEQEMIGLEIFGIVSGAVSTPAFCFPY